MSIHLPPYLGQNFCCCCCVVPGSAGYRVWVPLVSASHLPIGAGRWRQMVLALCGFWVFELTSSHLQSKRFTRVIFPAPIVAILKRNRKEHVYWSIYNDMDTLNLREYIFFTFHMEKNQTLQENTRIETFIFVCCNHSQTVESFPQKSTLEFLLHFDHTGNSPILLP